MPEISSEVSLWLLLSRRLYVIFDYSNDALISEDLFDLMYGFLSSFNKFSTCWTWRKLNKAKADYR